MKKNFSRLLWALLIAAAALSAAGCTVKGSEAPADQSPSVTVYAPSEQPYTLGVGDTTFPLSIVDLEGNEVQFEISTDETTVGAALVEVGLISGEAGPYGLMVTTVNGQRLVYEEDKAYWTVYVDGEYALTGVDFIEITEGQSYTLKAETA